MPAITIVVTEPTPTPTLTPTPPASLPIDLGNGHITTEDFFAALGLSHSWVDAGKAMISGGKAEEKGGDGGTEPSAQDGRAPFDSDERRKCRVEPG
ncbi:hypothetical protein PG997_009049 [Apiospora hydei]|uniref:Uncharacterized protein n=1 Tax=Apiospora hydei TaxID=1337664 RepID=A0ABR1VSY4_9PEZI